MQMHLYVWMLKFRSNAEHRYWYFQGPPSAQKASISSNPPINPSASPNSETSYELLLQQQQLFLQWQLELQQKVSVSAISYRVCVTISYLTSVIDSFAVSSNSATSATEIWTESRFAVRDIVVVAFTFALYASGDGSVFFSATGAASTATSTPTTTTSYADGAENRHVINGETASKPGGYER